MCGIVGYIGQNNAPEVLLRGLKRLEYRGYDSAGLAVIEDGEIAGLKTSGKVDVLGERLSASWDNERRRRPKIGIAHTRWATHGVPSDENAHPHYDSSGRFALVHNGIIENYANLLKVLQKEGIQIRSETDSEVLVHLISLYYDGCLNDAVCSALHQIQGTFGIAVICAEEPDRIVVARRGSPIVVGLGEGETIVASDAAPIIPYTRQVIYLNDNDVATLTCDGCDICDLTRTPVTREPIGLDWSADAVEKGGYEHFMLKEIFEQPESLENTIRGRLDHDQGTAILAGLNFSPREVVNIGRVVTVACGTSLFAGMTGKYCFEDLADLPCEVEQAAEFRYRNPIVNHSDMLLAISQSGETADTLAAVREGIQKGGLVAGVCNVVGSTIARETGRGVYLHAGPEIGVASTKAFTCQVVVMLMMALKFGRCHRLTRQRGIDICQEIEQIPHLVKSVLDEHANIRAIAGKYAEKDDFFYIGRGYLYPAALEGALKLKEISYIHAEGYHAAELKHGPIALLDEETPVVALLNNIPGKAKTLGNAEECRARNAPVVGVVTDGDEDLPAKLDDAIVVPEAPPYIAPILTVVALQLFAYYIALHRGCEIDKPRNLAKSVTVE